MQKPLKELISEEKIVWITQPQVVETLMKKRATAFEPAPGRYRRLEEDNAGRQAGDGKVAEKIQEKE